MPKFSANLGFLWTELRLPQAIHAAKEAGFDAVECHWPYEEHPEAVAAALKDSGLPMLGLNTRRGDVETGDNGLAALPGRQEEAHAAIDEAIAYAVAIGAANIHVMAGKAKGQPARATFIDNLRYAADQAAMHGKTILIEPLNHHDAPGYFLATSDQAVEILAAVDRANVKLMFDCYHVQIMEGDVTRRLTRLLPQIGHIQFASVPERGRPDKGELSYGHLFAHIDRLGWDCPLGAEYKPQGPTEASLGWMPA